MSDFNQITDVIQYFIYAALGNWDNDKFTAKRSDDSVYLLLQNMG